MTSDTRKQPSKTYRFLPSSFGYVAKLPGSFRQGVSGKTSSYTYAKKPQLAPPNTLPTPNGGFMAVS